LSIHIILNNKGYSF